MQLATCDMSTDDFEGRLEPHRRALVAHCRRMLGSGFEADDAVQETMVRAWRAYDGLEARSSLLPWLYRIATNVCFDMMKARQRRARPTDPTVWAAVGTASPGAGPGPEAVGVGFGVGAGGAMADDPADRAVEREDVRLAFVAALLHLPPKQRSVLLLCEVLRWPASDVAELLDTSVASVNSALQRARATLAEHHGRPPRHDRTSALDADQRALAQRYAEAFARHDVPTLVALLR